MSIEELKARIEAAPWSDDVLGSVLADARLDHSSTWAEFGVADGRSLRRLAAAKAGHSGALIGFDSFEGLPEAWREGHPAGEFRQDRIPLVPGAILIVGPFEETCYAVSPRRSVTLVHIDCDLYSSSRTALDWVATYCWAGTIVVFDEIIGYDGCEAHELRALDEWIINDFDFLYRGENQAALRVR